MVWERLSSQVKSRTLCGWRWGVEGGWSGQGRPVLRRAAMSRETRDLPRPGLPARTWTWPTAMRLGQSQVVGRGESMWWAAMGLGGPSTMSIHWASWASFICGVVVATGSSVRAVGCGLSVAGAGLSAREWAARLWSGVSTCSDRRGMGGITKTGDGGREGRGN